MGQINVNDLGGRKEMVENFGIWFSEKANPSQIKDWCDARIKKLDEWKANVQELRKQCQRALLYGLSVEDLQAALADRQAKQD